MNRNKKHETIVYRWPALVTFAVWLSRPPVQGYRYSSLYPQHHNHHSRYCCQSGRNSYRYCYCQSWIGWYSLDSVSYSLDLYNCHIAYIHIALASLARRISSYCFWGRWPAIPRLDRRRRRTVVFSEPFCACFCAFYVCAVVLQRQKNTYWEVRCN